MGRYVVSGIRLGFKLVCQNKYTLINKGRHEILFSFCRENILLPFRFFKTDLSII